MPPVHLKFGDDARAPLLAGAEKLAKAVVSTLGPWGRNASIRRGPAIPPLITKDGVTVARRITSLPDPFEDMGAQIVKEAAERTNRLAGDGTTTATLLAYEMMLDGSKLLSEGANAIHVKRGMQKACDAVIEKLKSMAKPVKDLDELKAIATLSAAGDEEIGSMVAMVVDEVGKDGAVQIGQGMGTGVEYEVTSGMQVATGYTSHHFANTKNGNCELKEPYILITTEKITSIQTILPIIQLLKDEDKNASLVVFSTGVEGDALSTFIVNLPRNLDDPNGGHNGLESLVLKPPFYGQRQIDVLEDIAIATGARIIDKKAGKSVAKMDVSDLGRCDSIVANAGVTTIVGLKGYEPKREQRKALIDAAIAEAETDADKDFLTMRKANITGKIAKIKVGGSSTTEQQEKQHRVEDAICAARAAHETGILPGGGIAFARCVLKVWPTPEIVEGDKDEQAGQRIVRDVLTQQLCWVARNAGENTAEVLDKVLSMGETEGFNAETGEYGDMCAMKVIDPAKVPITALKNAVSVAGMFLTCEVVVSEEDAPLAPR